VSFVSGMTSVHSHGKVVNRPVSSIGCAVVSRLHAKTEFIFNATKIHSFVFW